MQTVSGGFLNPQSIVADLNVQPGSRVADFGCGSGYFTLLLARAAGEDGLVAAVDVLKEKLETVKSAARAEGLFNINYIRADLETENGSQLDPDSQGLVMLANILFQSQKKDNIIKESRRVLKPGGALAVIDWEPASDFCPKETGWKISKEEARGLIAGLGFSVVREMAVASNHWGLLFRKP